ncbi:MAG: twin-arginine translocase subunit TatC [Methylophilaceae bacterium]|jgi:sec-independent protein translocase protein TatC|nr:twin-arginine translocase subunit TatC [Methylophilaceae bacterium]NCV37902.1 twin-arginine translocase subunit TatC [Betaproteobacteria bacterium]NCW62797.1 twin-arginine translocase subunit TatC [Betaproteobacteria bacterium]
MKNKFSFLDHFFIFKKLLLRVLIVFSIFFSLFFYNHQVIYDFFSDPLLAGLEVFGGEIIATQLLSTFIVPMKLSFLSAFYLTFPYLIAELWFFIKSGLYEQEKSFTKKIFLISTVLIFTAFLFCFYIVFPEIINFFMNFAPNGLNLKIDINFYLELLVNLIFAFTIAFQIPIIVIFLVKLKIINISKIKKARPYLYVFSFILAAILTPPDVLSQIFLALPMILLFELGLILSKLVTK